jgi:hypothetical protein
MPWVSPPGFGESLGGAGSMGGAIRPAVPVVIGNWGLEVYTPGIGPNIFSACPLGGFG